MNAALLQDTLQRQGSALLSHSEAGAVQWAKLSGRVDQAILRLLERDPRTITPQEAARILGELRRVLGQGAAEAAKLADQDALSVFRLGYGHQSDYFAQAYGARDALSVRAGRVAETFARFDQQLRSGQILRGDYWGAQRVNQTQTFVDRHREITKEVQRRMTLAYSTDVPATTRDIAAVVRPMVEGTTGRMPADQWSRNYARTSQSQTYNDFAETIAVQAGVDKYVNVGVADERQSKECYEASQQPPMTMEEWDQWRASNGKGGRPGSRHVFNCRCVSGPVPPGLEDEDWTQPNPRYEGVAA